MSPETSDHVAAIEPLTGSNNYATWKRLVTSYLKARQLWDVVSGEMERPDCLFKYAKPITADVLPLIGPNLNGAVRQKAIETRLELEVQGFERYKNWCKCEGNAYHIIFRYLSPEVSIHAAGIGTSRELWNDLEERYRRMELATYCELFAQLKETTGDSCKSTREFVDRVRLLVSRLNGIAPGSIGDKAHIAILLTQIGPEYAFIVDAIQNDKETVSPTAVGTRLANAERTVRGKESASRSAVGPTSSINAVRTSVKRCTYCKRRGHDLQRCWKKKPYLNPHKDKSAKADGNDSGSPNNNDAFSNQKEDRQGPPAPKRPKINVVKARATALYTRAPNSRWILDSAATSHICWDRDCFTSLRQHQEMLDTAGDPVEAEGIGTVKLILRGKPHRTLVLKDVYYAPRIGMNLVSVPKLLRDRYSVVAHPHEILLQCKGRTVGTVLHTEDDLLVLRCQVSCKSSVHVNLVRDSTETAGTQEPREVDMEVDPQELSEQHRTAVASELNSGEAMVLDEDAAGGDCPIPEGLWHARLGHLNRGDLRVVLGQSGTPYRQLSNQELLATPQCPACMSGKQHQKR